MSKLLCRISITLGAILLSGAALAATDERSYRWIASWTAAPSNQAGILATPEPLPIEDLTFRTVIRLSVGGSALRVRLSNELGDRPLKLDDVHVALWREGNIVHGTDRQIAFNGAATTTIAAGDAIVSDAAPISVNALQELAISIHVPGPMPGLTAHVMGQNTTWMSVTDEAARERLTSALPTFVRYVLSGLEVAVNSPHATTVVALGDSITDGERSTFDLNRRWPDYFAERLHSAGLSTVGVANQGISGNRLLRGGSGISALARLDRDVFRLPNVSTLVVLEGINDLGVPIAEGTPMPTTDELISAYSQIVTQAHDRGIKVIGSTLMPYKGIGPGYYSLAGDKIRGEVNQWMRSSHVFDVLVDLDHLTADPRDPARLAPNFDSGDGLHPSDRGYAAMAKAFDQARESLSSQ